MHALLLAAEETRDIGIPIPLVGIIAFLILIGLLLAVLSFGKGREHT